MFQRSIINLNWIHPLLILIIGSLTSACGATPTTPAEITVQAALPTPTLEPTFTPSPPPTDAFTPTLTDTPTPAPSPTPAPRAEVSGRILDQATNRPITDAQVRAGDQTATTNANGRYTLTGLKPDQYVLSVIHPDYDPGLSSIFTVVEGQELEIELALYAPDTSPYPQDPMLINPLDPNGAPTEKDAIRLAQEQGLIGEVVSIEETTLTGEYLVNYKIGQDIRAAVAALNHEAWELTDEAGQKWAIIKVCGNLASSLSAQKPIPTPKPIPLPPLAEVVADELVVRTCASEECAEVGTIPLGMQVEVFGCLADGVAWCEVGWLGGRGWCTGQSLRQLAVVAAVPVVEPVDKFDSDCGESIPGIYTQQMENLTSIIVAGKPDFRNGAMVPLLICSSLRPRKLKITIELAISEAGTPLVESPRVYLFRSFNEVVPDGIHSHNPVYANVEHDYTTNSGWSLEEVVTPGLYLLVFEHDSYEDLINPRESKDIPQSVTYRLELADIP